MTCKFPTYKEIINYSDSPVLESLKSKAIYNFIKKKFFENNILPTTESIDCNNQHLKELKKLLKETA